MKIKLTIVIILTIAATIFTFSKGKAKVRMIVVPEDYSTIQEAIINGADGDTVFVKRGIYLIEEDTTIVWRNSLSFSLWLRLFA